MIMARTSDETRLNLFPALLARIDGPPAASVRQIPQGAYLAQIVWPRTDFLSMSLNPKAVSLSGLAFAFHGKEAELLNLIE